MRILDRIRSEKGRLEAVLGKLSEAQMLAAGLESERSVKDSCGQHQRPGAEDGSMDRGAVCRVGPKRPALGLIWDDPDPPNEQICRERREPDLSNIRAASDQAYEQASKTIQGMADHDILDGRGLPGEGAPRCGIWGRQPTPGGITKSTASRSRAGREKAVCIATDRRTQNNIDNPRQPVQN